MVTEAINNNKATRHCTHCLGGNGPCQCSFGCSVGRLHKCYAYFPDRTCAFCRKIGIKGNVYQCNDCQDIGLCVTWYHRKVHPEHDFVEIRRKGRDTIFHEAQNKCNPALSPAEASPQRAKVAPRCPPPLGEQGHSVPNLQPSLPFPTVHVSPQNKQQQQSTSRTHVERHSTTNQQPPQSPLGVSAPLQQQHHHHQICIPITTPTTKVSTDLCSLSVPNLPVYVPPPFQHPPSATSSPPTKPKIVHPAPGQLPTINKPAIHEGVFCDVCQCSNFVGSRYQCFECRDGSFDLCSECWEYGAHGHHDFWKYESPDAQPTFEPARCPPSSLVLHPNVICDGCGIYPLTGSRYNCQDCESFDLCEYCYTEKAHGHHGFWRYTKPGASPVSLDAQRPPSAPLAPPLENEVQELTQGFDRATGGLAVAPIQDDDGVDC